MRDLRRNHEKNGVPISEQWCPHMKAAYIRPRNVLLPQSVVQSRHSFSVSAAPRYNHEQHTRQMSLGPPVAGTEMVLNRLPHPQARFQPMNRRDGSHLNRSVFTTDQTSPNSSTTTHCCSIQAHPQRLSRKDRALLTNSMFVPRQRSFSYCFVPAFLLRDSLSCINNRDMEILTNSMSAHLQIPLPSSCHIPNEQNPSALTGQYHHEKRLQTLYRHSYPQNGTAIQAPSDSTVDSSATKLQEVHIQ